jgi:hypothetical protein
MCGTGYTKHPYRPYTERVLWPLNMLGFHVKAACLPVERLLP